MKVTVKGEMKIFVSTEVEIDELNLVHENGEILDGEDLNEKINELAIEAAEEKVTELTCYPNFSGATYGFDSDEEGCIDETSCIEWSEVIDE